MAIRDGLLPEFDLEMAGTRKVIERVPDGKFDYKLHPKSFTMGALAEHLAVIPAWISMVLEKAEVDVMTPEAHWKSGATTAAGLVAAFDASLAKARALLAGVSDEALQQVWTLRAGDRVIFSLPRIVALRSFCMNHMIHHRGQATMYLRQLDVPVPGLYGPSADEK
jgi:uncharacterized damage-inducible protein DinB